MVKGLQAEHELHRRRSGRNIGLGIVLALRGAPSAARRLALALTALALNLSPNPYAALEIVFWLMGSLADRSWAHVAAAAPVMANRVAQGQRTRPALA